MVILCEVFLNESLETQRWFLYLGGDDRERRCCHWLDLSTNSSYYICVPWVKNQSSFWEGYFPWKCMETERENGNTLLLSKIHQNYFQGYWHKGSDKRLLRSKMARGLKGQFILPRGCHWRRQWHPTPVLLPGKSHGWRSLVGCSQWGREESDMTERLHFHFSLSCFGEGNGNPLQCSCLENPRDGVAQSWTRLKWLSSNSSTGCHCPLLHAMHRELVAPALGSEVAAWIQV